MALLSAKDFDKKDEAPEESGADSVKSEVAETTVKTEEKSKKQKSVKPKRTVSFHVPFAPMGNAGISLPHPVLDKEGKPTGEIEHKQIKLKDQFFSITKKEADNSAYFAMLKKLFAEQGLQLYTTLDNIEDLKKYRDQKAAEPESSAKAAKRQKVFGAFHPEHVSSELTFNIAFQCGENVRSFMMEKGRLFTKEKALHSIFLKNGFQDLGYVKDSQKLSKEIVPKEEDSE